MSKPCTEFIKNIVKASWISACACGLAMSAYAVPQPSTATLTTTKSAPVFLGDGGSYPFSEAVRVGNTLYLSGQIGMKNNQLVKGGIKAETKQALDNITTTLLTYGYQPSDIVKCTAMLTNMDHFGDFNQVYQTQWSKPYPARSAFGVKKLAAGASVEIECMAAK